MNLFFDALERAVFGNVERRDSGPAHLDKTSDEYYLTDDQVEAQDSLFDIEGEDK